MQGQKWPASDTEKKFLQGSLGGVFLNQKKLFLKDPPCKLKHGSKIRNGLNLGKVAA